LKNDPYKQIWDFAYISSSDEEDDEDSSSESDSDSSDEEQKSKVKKEKQVKPDVVDLLLEKDKPLQQRDYQHRINRFERTKKSKQSVRIYAEEPELKENYSKWFNPDDEDSYFSMNSRHRTCYRAGD
jgi:hypothetical protein